jgi:hypothetical protein
VIDSGNGRDDEDDDAIDPSDWVASQFDPTEQIPQAPKAAVPPAAVTPPPVPPLPPAVPSQPSAPPAAAPPAESQQGFSWGLRPSQPSVPAPAGAAPDAVPPATVPSPPQPPASAPPVFPTGPVAAGSAPAAPTLPPAGIPSYDLPTQAISQQDLPSLVEPTAPGAAAQNSQPPTAPTTQPMSWQDVQDMNAPIVPPAAAPPVSVPMPTDTEAWDPFADAGPLTPPRGAVPATPPTEPRDPTSALDSLFGQSKFVEYEEVGLLQTINPTADPDAGLPPKPPREPLSSAQKMLMGIAGALIGILVLLGLFLIGRSVGSAATPAPTKTSAAQTAKPTTPPAGVPLAPGVHAYNTLQGGECIEPFTSVWASSFTVVDCATAHTEQLIAKGTLPEDDGAAYPSSADLVSEISPLCTDHDVLNYTNAAKYSDIQLSVAYPPTADAWAQGDRTYYCFVGRKSGDQIGRNLAVAQK